jgi:hypothetical protein
MVPLNAHPSFFLTSIFFSCTQHFPTFYVSLYDIYTKKNNQTAVSIHTGFRGRFRGGRAPPIKIRKSYVIQR